ncbi:hypothetical protein AZZ81_000348, partial [Klebsiella aerogenes]
LLRRGDGEGYVSRATVVPV